MFLVLCVGLYKYQSMDILSIYLPVHLCSQSYRSTHPFKIWCRVVEYKSSESTNIFSCTVHCHKNTLRVKLDTL